MKNEWPLSYVLYQGWEQGYDEKRTDEALSVLAKVGYKGVELPGLYWFKTVDEVKAVVSLVKKRGLEVAETKHTFDFVRQDEKERRMAIEGTKTALSLAAGAGIDKVQVFTGPGFGQNPLHIGKDISEGKAWEYVFAAFDEIVPAAEKLDVCLTVEPVYNMCVRDYYTLMELINHCKSKAVVVNFDVGNFNLYGNDLAWVTRRLGSLIKNTHIHDSVGRAGLDTVMRQDVAYTLVGQGSVDWKNWFHALNEIGYRGYLSVEFRGPWLEGIMSFEDMLKTFKTALDRQIEMA